MRSLQSLQAYRAIAATLVMLFHTDIICSDPRYLGIAPAPFFLAGAAGVPFFFVLSGYIIARSHHPSKHGIRQAANFLLKRVLRLYPMLWIVLLAVVPALVIELHRMPGIGYLLFSFLAIPTASVPPLAVEWTLQHEMLFYVLYAGILCLPKLAIPILSLLAVSSLIGPFLHLPFPGFFFVDPSHLLFVLGVVVALVQKNVSKFFASILLVLGCVVFCLNYLLTLRQHTTLLPYVTEWPYGIAACLIIFASAQLETYRSLSFPKWLVKLGDASYVLYLIHFPILSFELKLFMPLERKMHIPLILLYLLLPLIATVISLAVHEAVERKFLAPMAKQLYQRFAMSISSPLS